jgi:hypothetical protein
LLVGLGHCWSGSLLHFIYCTIVLIFMLDRQYYVVTVRAARCTMMRMMVIKPLEDGEVVGNTWI